MTRLRSIFDSIGSGVLVAGVAGFVVFFAVLPLVHPDASSRSTPDAVVDEKVAAFVTPWLPADEEYTRQSAIVRDRSLLLSLQREHSPREVTRALGEGAYDPLPLYSRRLQWYAAATANESRSLRAELRMLEDGGVVYADLSGLDEYRVDEAALQSVGIARADVDERIPLFESPDGVPVFDPSAQRRIHAEALARFHLNRSAFASLALSVDSTIIRQNNRVSTARVVFSGDSLVHGRRLTLDVEVTSLGALNELRLRRADVDGADGTAGPEITVGASSREGAGALVSVIAHALLFIVILILFFRRLDTRMVDMTSALRDALWGGAWVMVATALTAGYLMVSSLGGATHSYFIALLIAVTSGAGAFVLLYVAAAVGDSYLRATEPESLQSLDLIRRMRMINRPVGRAIVAAFLIAGAILGLQTLALFLPGASLELENDFPHVRSLRPFLSSFGTAAWYGAYIGFLVLAIPSGFAFRGWKAAAIVLPIILAAVLDVTPLTLYPLPLGLIAGAVTGGVLVGALRRFDLLTVIAAIVIASILTSTASGWLADGVPDRLDSFAAIALVFGLLAIGFVGLWREDVAADRATFVPEYVIEMGRQQRIERELELARQVQQSFLPTRIPHVVGVDVAAICIPATEVGGDYYDFFRLDDYRLGVVVGDVSGKGIKAAFYMTLVKGIVKTVASGVEDPAAVLRAVNRHFYENVPRGAFISLIYGVVDVRDGSFSFARAGHNPLLVRTAEGASFETPPGMAVGLAVGSRFDATLRTHVINLDTGDLVVLYTDGITEAMDGARRQFGERRLAESIVKEPERAAEIVLAELQRDLEDFTIGATQNDDMTAVVLRYLGPTNDEPIPAYESGTIAVA